MKTVLFFSFALFLFIKVYGQDKNYIKKPALGLNFILNDFSDKEEHLEMSRGIAINYIKGINNHVDFNINLAGSYLDYPMKGRPDFSKKYFLTETDLSVNAKLLSDKNWVSPYLVGGVGLSKYKQYYGMIIPLGAGLQVNFHDDAFVFLNSQYRIKITNNTESHFYYSIGIAGSIGKKKPIKSSRPFIVPVKPQRVALNEDTLTAKNDSAVTIDRITDSDKDGIPDIDDKCPQTAGMARYNGCPTPDSDNDGVNDEIDGCPLVPGLVNNKGCPINDSDNDGIADQDDRCPNINGPSQNGGCPVVDSVLIKKVDLAAKNIFFPTNGYQILPTSFDALNQVAVILKHDQNLKIKISGHTDHSGNTVKNKILSQHRALSIRNYLVSHGIDEKRMTADGFGQERPIADNDTEKGRALNRRVEMILSY